MTATFNHTTGEPRLLAMGMIGDDLYALVFSIETARTRIISLRRANRREVKHYVQNA